VSLLGTIFLRLQRVITLMKIKGQIKSKIAQHLVDESDFNFVMMHLLNHYSDHVCQLGNRLNISFELQETAMMDLKHV
jgi:hypothetical protein